MGLPEIEPEPIEEEAEPQEVDNDFIDDFQEVPEQKGVVSFEND